MHVVYLLSIFICVLEVCNGTHVLSRQKRYLVFPEGSSLSIAICMTAQTDITPGELFTEGINWGISYDLPNDTKQFKEVLNKPKKLMQRRHRRELYTKMETILNSMGYNGRECIQRVLCETSRNLLPKGESLLDEILRIVFGYPSDQDEWKDVAHFQYSKALQSGLDDEKMECSQLFSRCPFSLIDLAQGYYSLVNGLSPYTYNDLI